MKARALLGSILKESAPQDELHKAEAARVAFDTWLAVVVGEDPETQTMRTGPQQARGAACRCATSSGGRLRSSMIRRR